MLLWPDFSAMIFSGTFELNILVIAIALREWLVHSHPPPVSLNTVYVVIFE